MHFYDGRIHWDVQFCYPVHDWELESLALFMNITYSTFVQGVGPDEVCWKRTKSQGFEVWGYYHILSPSIVISFPWKMVWQSKVPPRVAFFFWSDSLGKILTTDNPQKRWIIVLDRCYMRKRCGELVDHLLLHCLIAYELWSPMLCLFGIHWVMLHRVIKLLASWQVKFSQHHNIAIWRLVLHCLTWCIWWEWNARSFEGCEWPILKIKSFFFHTLLEWSLVLPTFSCFSLHVLLDYCNFGSWLFCPYSTFPVYLGWLCFLIKFFITYKKKIKIICHLADLFIRWSAFICIAGTLYLTVGKLCPFIFEL